MKPKTEKPKADKPQLTVRLARETYDMLLHLCHVSHLSQTAHVQVAMNEYLPRELAKYPAETKSA